MLLLFFGWGRRPSGTPVRARGMGGTPGPRRAATRPVGTHRVSVGLPPDRRARACTRRARKLEPSRVTARPLGANRISVGSPPDRQVHACARIVCKPNLRRAAARPVGANLVSVGPPSYRRARVRTRGCANRVLVGPSPDRVTCGSRWPCRSPLSSRSGRRPTGSSNAPRRSGCHPTDVSRDTHRAGHRQLTRSW